jgi:hypothetical protein
MNLLEWVCYRYQAKGIPWDWNEGGNCSGAGPDPALEEGTSLTKNKCRLTDGLHLFCTPGGT